MAGVKARQFPVGDQVEARQFLRLEHDHYSVTQNKARRIADQPGWNRITSDDGCLDTSSHLCACKKYGNNSDLFLVRSREMDGQSMWRERDGVKDYLQFWHIRFDYE